MKRFLTVILCTLIVFASIPSSVFAAKKEEHLVTKKEIRKIQTRIYKTEKSDEVYQNILKVLDEQNYKVIYKNPNIMYVKAFKKSKVKDISKLLVIGYILKTGFDICQAILTYGIRTYTVVGDLALIKLEFDKKDLDTIVGIKVTPNDSNTQVRINISKIMTGKRDGLYIGKKNRLKTLLIRDPKEYNEIFTNLSIGIEKEKE